MNRDRLWLAIAILLPALAATIAPMSTVDLAYQVRAGDLMLGSLAILRADPFTFTATGDPWLYQQWGAGVVLAAGHGLGGWGGLVVLRVVLVAAAVGLVMVGCRRRLTARPATLLALAGFVVGAPSLGLRAQLFGIVLFAAVIAILAWRDRLPRLAWAIPLLVLAWANLHGSFFLGPLAVGVALAEDTFGRRPDVRQMLAVLGLSLVATAITPFGPAVWEYALGIATNPEITRLITEWQRTPPFTVTGALFYLSVIGAAAALVRAIRWKGMPVPVLTIAWLAGLAFLGWYAERAIAWWAFGAPVALAPTIAALLARAATREGGAPALPATQRPERRFLRAFNVLLVGLLVVAVVALQPAFRPADPLTGPEDLLRGAPGGVAIALADLAGPADRAVVPQPWASWLEWAAPGVPVMVDSRVEVVPASTWINYSRIVSGGPAALDTLRGVAATAVVVDRATQTALELALRAPGSGWRLEYEDVESLLFLHVPRAVMDDRGIGPPGAAGTLVGHE